MNKGQYISELSSKQEYSIFTQNQDHQSVSYIIQEDQLKNHSNDDSISIYLEKSNKIKSDENDQSFVVQQLSQSQYLTTNQLQQYQDEQLEMQKEKDRQQTQSKRKIALKHKQIRKQSKEQNWQKKENQKKQIYRPQRKVRVPINQNKLEQMQILFEKNQKERIQGESKTTLKQISEFLNLGYSTVLHKYRQFRQFGTIQKGVLLQCKDIRRKYKKSEQIQIKIVEALKTRKFNTAIQLAKFIQDNYGLKVSRSIVSRHLNEMKNQKINEKITKKMKLHIQNTESLERFYNSPNSEFMSLGQLGYFNKFKQFLLNMKRKNKPLYFFESFNIVLMDKTVYFQAGVDDILNSYINFDVLIISLTSDGNSIINSSFQLVSAYQISKFTEMIKNFVYVYVQERLKQIIKILTIQRKCCLVYNFRTNQKEKCQRQSLYKLADDKDFDLMFMPPHVEQLNFMRRWFYQNVFSEINIIKFCSSQTLKETVQEILLAKQNGIKQYSEVMFSNILTYN